MPDTKISALTAGSPVLTTDDIPARRGAGNVRVNLGALAAANTATDVPAAGSATNYTPSASTVAGNLIGIDNALSEFQREITVAAGGVIVLSEATHRNALIKINTTSLVTINPPGVSTGIWLATVFNNSTAEHVVLGQTVTPQSLTTLLLDGVTGKAFSTSQTKDLSIFIPTGANGVIWRGTPLFGVSAYTVLSVQNQTESGSITLSFDIETALNSNTFTAITGMSAVTVDTTKSTDTATAANVSDNGQRQLRINASSNSSATNIILTVRVRV